jgi:hypothetical protein
MEAGLSRAASGLLRHLLWASLIALLLAPPGLSAGRMYRYRDANGILHVTDRAPEDPRQVTEYRETVVQPDTQDIVDMSMPDSDGEHIATFVSHIAGPVAIRAELVDPVNVRSEPSLPADLILSDFERRAAIRVFPADRAKDSSFGLRYSALPGAPDARHDNQFRYALPLPADSGYVLAQGFDGGITHDDDQSRYAVDLGVDEGTPVLAAREGKVMMVEDGFHGAGTDRARFQNRANYVRIVHDDGSMAVYAHLQQASAVVKPGQRVRQGQRIALSGNTGYSTGPHLHFAVQLNADMALMSVPVRFADRTMRP